MPSRGLAGGMAFAAGALVVVSCTFCSSARAADLRPAPPIPAPAPPIAYAPQVYNWTGIYVGGHIGAGFVGSSFSDPIAGGSETFDNSGFLGGGQVGANAQFNRMVVGVEGDFSWMNLSNGSTDSIGVKVNTDVQWTSTATGRIGAAFDRLLVYGKGGLALAQDKSSLTDLSGNTASDGFLRTGWTAGAGFEYAFTDNWSAKVEYDYLGFGPQAMNFTTPTGSVSPSARLNVQEVKAGVNLRFGGGQ
jgi:outer membrane immunogenic protein